MQRILFRHICNNWMRQILGVLAVIGVVLAWNVLIYYNNAEYMTADPFWESYLNMIGTNAGLLAVIVARTGISHMLPDALFLMPLSKKEREQATVKSLLASWLGMSIIIGIGLYLPIIVTSQLNGLDIIWILLFLLLLAYICQYYEYFFINDVYTGMIFLLGMVFLCTMALIILIPGLGFASEWIGIKISAISLAGVNIYIHKKYFKEMVRYYADYESVRQLKEKKKSKK